MRHSLPKISSGIIRKHQIKGCCTALLLAGAMLSLSIASATSIDLHSVVLSVQGNINFKENHVLTNEVFEFDLASLTKLKATTFTTNQPWTNEPKEYTGVRINTFLDHVGANSSDFNAIAGNDYTFTLRNIDFEKYPIIIAYKIDGEFLDTRSIGPLLIVFPFDDHPKLLNEKNKASSVWQLTEMQIL